MVKATVAAGFAVVLDVVEDFAAAVAFGFEAVLEFVVTAVLDFADAAGFVVPVVLDFVDAAEPAFDEDAGCLTESALLFVVACVWVELFSLG
jgi:uncharacterized membrane protein YfhO